MGSRREPIVESSKTDRLNEFIIHPYQGVGELRFGEPIEKARVLLGREKQSFIRAPEFPANLIYDFPDYSLFINTTEDGKTESFEFYEFGNPTLFGINLLSLSFADLKFFLTKNDIDLIEDGEVGSLLSNKFGLSTFAPNAADDPGKPVEALLVFPFGYFDL